jgi:hypothetical protein
VIVHSPSTIVGEIICGIFSPSSDCDFLIIYQFDQFEALQGIRRADLSSKLSTPFRNKSFVRANDGPFGATFSSHPRTRSNHITDRINHLWWETTPRERYMYVGVSKKCAHINGKLQCPAQHPSLLRTLQDEPFHVSSNPPSKALVPTAPTTASIRQQAIVAPAVGRRDERPATPVSSPKSRTASHPRSFHEARPASQVGSFRTPSTHPVSLALSPRGGPK